MFDQVEVDVKRQEVDAKIKVIGNLVHDSVPVDDNEVSNNQAS